ncbi:MAG: hypothetical protein K8T20_15000 [Planctomycetes bacterium]|nr:hypothetical protein [Planctomycetota bacterium]
MRRIATGLVLCAVLLAACGKKTPDPSPPSSPPPAGPSPTTIGPSGGHVESGGARLEIPAGAMETEATFGLRETSAPPWVHKCGPAMEIATDRANFAKPVTVVFPVHFPSGAATGEVSAILMFGGVSERLRGGELDAAAGTFTIKIDRLFPIANGDSAPGDPNFAAFPTIVPNVDPSQRVVLPKEDGVEYVYLKSVEEEALKLLPDVKEAIAKGRAAYAAMHFKLPAELHVGLRPLAPTAGAHSFGGDSIEVNTAHPSNNRRSSLESSIMHEMAHLVQQTAKMDNLRALHVELNMNTVHPEVGRWVDEGTAEFFSTKICPNYTADFILRLRRDFPLQPIRRWNDPDCHEYAMGIFFCWLDTLYDGTELIREVYRIHMTAQIVESTLAEDRAAQRGSFDPLIVLDSVLQRTPDRKGRQRNLRAVFADFLLALLWKKDFEPVASNMVNVEQVFGPAGQIKLPEPANRLDWDLPDGPAEARVAKKTETVSGESWQIVKVIQITSKTMPAKKETGELRISLKTPRNMPQNSAVLIVFPTRKVLQEPEIGNASTPVRIADWDECRSATVWVVDVSRYGNWDLGVTAEFVPVSKTTDTKEFVLTMDDFSSGNWRFTRFSHFNVKLKREMTTEEMVKALEGPDKDKHESRWMRLAVDIGGVKSTLYGKLELYPTNRFGSFGGDVHTPFKAGKYQVSATCQLYGKTLQVLGECEVPRDPRHVEEATKELAERTKSLEGYKARLEKTKKGSPEDPGWLKEQIVKDLRTIFDQQLTLRDLDAAREAAKEAASYGLAQYEQGCTMMLAELALIDGDPATYADLTKNISPIRKEGPSYIAEHFVRDLDDRANGWKWFQEYAKQPGVNALVPFPRPDEEVLK